MAVHTLREQIENRKSSLRKERQSFIGHYKELSDNILPVRGRFLTKTGQNKGNKRNVNIIDNTGTLALRTLVAGLGAGLTSPARPWFRLGMTDDSLSEFGPVRDWLNTVQRLMFQVFSASNMYNVFPSSYQEVGLFGTDAYLLSEDFEDTIRGYNFTAGEYMIATNGRGVVNTLYRETPYTVGQLVDKFGKDKLSRAAKNLYDKGSYDEWINVTQAIEPNVNRDLSKKDSVNMSYRSVYVEDGSDTHTILGQSGFNEFPVIASRWEVVAGDIYGTACPGMDSLGDIKQLQMQQKRKGQAIDKMTNPPLKAPSDMRGKRISALPGDVTYYDTNSGGDGVSPMYLVNLPLGELKQDMDEVRERINSAFFADLFLMLSMSDRRQITATEVAERHEEKLLMLGPVLERFNGEKLDPTIARTFAIMTRAGMIPPAPDEIQGLPLKVEYISLLAQAQRAVGVGAINGLIGIVGGMANMQPDVIDKIDFDQAVDEVGVMMGAPSRVVRSDDKVLEIRQERASRQAAADQQAATAQAASNAKMLSESKLDGDNALAQILSGGV